VPNSFLLNFRGELSALSAALIWAIASVIYLNVAQQLSPLVLNFSKGVISIAFVLITLLLQGNFFPETTPAALGLLILSGAIGIGIGDTAYFEALYCLGARRALLLEALAPPLSAVLALLFLQEHLTWQSCLGIALTIGGVTWVVVERASDPEGIYPLRGISFGAIAALGQASGSVMSRAALAQTDITPLWSTLIRLVAGVLVLVIWLSWQRQSYQGLKSHQGLKSLRSPRVLGIVTITAFFSTYLAIWLQQVALKFTAAGIAQALSATSPLFILPLTIAFKERVSPRAIIGVLIALSGIGLLFL
jgi:drug/metabolite transporter (DMT)-like permease